MAQPMGMKACLFRSAPHIQLKMARPIGVKSYLKTESVENGATNKNIGVFRFYSQLKLAQSLPEVCLNTEIIEVNCIHYIIQMQILPVNKLCITMA
jgi:hypothetical protein